MLKIPIKKQPDETTCGPTCLHSLYEFYEDPVALADVINDVHSFEDLRSGIIRQYLKKGQPLIAGLSATYLYRSKREFGPNLDYDDLRGEPTGHFVLLHGYTPETREVSIADPISQNPLGEGPLYKMKIDRVLNAILLGIITYDANLIIITPKH